jgi:dihydrofolate reductase
VKVILFIATSLDGRIAGPDDDISWLFTDADYGYSDFVSKVDALIMGRGTYQVVNTFGDWPYKGKKTFVVTRSKDITVTTALTTAFNGDLVDLVADLSEQGCERVWLVGGGELVTSFVQQELIDEIIVSLHPVLLGTGVPLFTGIFPRVMLDLEGIESYDSGLVQLRYAVVPKDE